MSAPLHSQAPTLFWFYRLVGLGAIVGAVALGRKRSGGLGTIPPMPSGSYASRSDVIRWAKKTFAPGTRVRTKVDRSVSPIDRIYDDDSIVVPAGSQGVVRSFVNEGDDYGMLVKIVGTVTTPLFTSSIREEWETLESPDYLYLYFEPIDDNWGPLTVSSPKRHVTPPQRGWAKQLRQSRRRP